MKRNIAVSLVLIAALIGCYLSVIVVGEWVEEHKYLYSSPLDYALDYLSDDIYQNLAIEVDWVIGREPDWDAMNFLIEKMREYCDKERIYIDFNVSEEIAPGGDFYTLEVMREMERESRGLHKRDGTSVIYFLYLNGKYADTGGYFSVRTEVTGLAYGRSSIAIFKDELEAVEASGLDKKIVEKSILLHEFGHLIGLVGIGYHAEHEDPEHPHHTLNRDGVMYYAINASEGALPPPLDFCNDSKKDIQFIKSRSRKVSNIIYIPWLLIAADILSAGLLLYFITYPDHRYRNEELLDQYEGDEHMEEEEMYF